MSIDLRNERFICLLFGLLLFVPIFTWYYRPGGDGLDITGHLIGRDFINNWVGPRLAYPNNFGILFDYDAYFSATQQLFGRALPFHNWGYPPFTLPAFQLLAQLPYFWALAVWTLGLFAAFAWTTLAQVDGPERRIALLCLALAPATLINAVGGQNGFLSATLLLGGVLLLDRRPLLAGLLIGLLTFKPHLGIVIFFVLIALGAWRAFFAAAATAAALVAISVWLLGTDIWRQYLAVTGAYQVGLLKSFEGFFVLMTTSVLSAGRTIGLSFEASAALQAAVSLPVIVATMWAARRTADPLHRAAIVALATPLVTPYAFNYDLTAVAAVIVWKLAGALPRSEGDRPLLLAGWIAPLALMFLNAASLPVAPLVLLALFGVEIRAIARKGSGEKELSPTNAAARSSVPIPVAGSPG